MPDYIFEHSPDNLIELVPGQVLNVQITGDPDGGFDPDNSITHFRYKMYARALTDDFALRDFKVEFYTEDMQASSAWGEDSTVVIQDGWIGNDLGDTWGLNVTSAGQATFVSDHEHYGTSEGDYVQPYLGPYIAQDGGTDWQNDVIDKSNREDRLPAGGYGFIRFSLAEGAAGNVIIEMFSFEFTYEEYHGRKIYPVPLTQGWVCNNDFEVDPKLYVIIHRGMAYLYGGMFDWYNYNAETEEEWFTNVYDDATTEIVPAGGIPESARPAGRVVVPIRMYDFERTGAALGMTWHLEIGTDGSIKILSRSGRPDKLRLGGGAYSFTPMQVRWPIADQTYGPDTDDGGSDGLTWETHNELINNSEAGGSEVWTIDQDIQLAYHGGITHLRAAVHHSVDEAMDVPLSQLAGIVDGDGGNIFAAVKILDDSPGGGQDFGFIEQFTLELSDIPDGGAVVNFDASASTGLEPLEYSWHFGDGSTGSGKTPSHTYENAGTYWVKLTVTDPKDRSDSVTKKPKSADPTSEGYPGESNDWAAYVNDRGAVINSTAQHTLFISADPLTQIFKGEDMVSGSIPNAPGTHLVGSGDLAPYFAADKNLLYGGFRLASILQRSPEMPWETASVVGRKYGTAVCLQGDGSHYRHEVECITAGDARTNVYRHKLIKCVSGADTVIAGPVDNQYPDCGVTGFISFTNVEKVQWSPNLSTVEINDAAVPKSGVWGIFFTEGVTQSQVMATGNSFPSYPAPDEVIKINAWWPSVYVYDEPPVP